MGGALAAIEAGYQQRQIQEAAYRVQREVEAEERIVVGVNRFRDDDRPHARTAAHRPGRRARPGRPRPARLRAERDAAGLGRGADAPG